MKERCKAKILQQYGSSDINKLLDIATFLDPRFKHYKDDDQKKKEIEELIKLEILHIASWLLLKQSLRFKLLTVIKAQQ